MSELLAQVRYGLAVMVVISLPGALAWWFVVHPFADFWRRLGARRSLAILFGAFFALAAALFFVRDTLVGRDLGPPHPGAVAAGALLLVLAFAGQIWVGRSLTRKILVGVPEMSREEPGRLLTGGPYAYTRNPRYLVILIAMLAYGLLLSYTGVWVLAALCFPALYSIILLEERELVERFGDEYARYCRRVRRLLPVWPARRPNES